MLALSRNKTIFERNQHNSVYAYINDYKDIVLENDRNSGALIQSIVNKSSPSFPNESTAAEYLLISLKVPKSEEDIIEHHIRIDSTFSKENSLGGEHLTPCHYTATTRNKMTGTSSTHRIHVNNHLKIICVTIPKGWSQTTTILNESESKFFAIIENAAPYLALILKFSIEKEQKWQELYKKNFNLEAHLAQLHEKVCSAPSIDMHEKHRATLSVFLETEKKIHAYTERNKNDVITAVGKIIQGQLYETEEKIRTSRQALHSTNEPPETVISSKIISSENNLPVREINHHNKIIKDKIKNAKSTLQEIPYIIFSNKINILILNNIITSRKTLNLCETYDRNIQALFKNLCIEQESKWAIELHDALSSIIDFSSHYPTITIDKTFDEISSITLDKIIDLRKKLNLGKTWDEDIQLIFKKLYIAHESDLAIKLHDALSSIIDFSFHYQDIIKMITIDKISDDQLEKMVHMAGHLYQKSPLYRSCLISFGSTYMQEFTEFEKEGRSVSFGILAWTVANNRLSVFEMLLFQGFSVDICQVNYAANNVSFTIRDYLSLQGANHHESIQKIEQLKCFYLKTSCFPFYSIVYSHKENKCIFSRNIAKLFTLYLNSTLEKVKEENANMIWAIGMALDFLLEVAISLEKIVSPSLMVKVGATLTVIVVLLTLIVDQFSPKLSFPFWNTNPNNTRGPAEPGLHLPTLTD